jgi:hypothetical protein
MMSEHDNFVAENAASQQELRALLGELSDADLAYEMSDGWTVAAFLAHVAFYDFRAAQAVARWRSDSELASFEEDAELTNATVVPLLLALPPSAVRRLSLEAAQAADAAVGSVEPELLARIAPVNRSVGFFRSAHRREHIDQIKAALKK